MDRDNERSSVLVDDLFQWVIAASKWSQDSEASLFTREHAPLGVKGHKEITAKEVNEAIKHSAVLCNLKGRYSAKSCRTYVATVASREGMPPGELRKLGCRRSLSNTIRGSSLPEGLSRLIRGRS